MHWFEYIFLIFICTILLLAASQRFSMRKGKFAITKNSIHFLSFSTDLGNFHFKFNELSLFANFTKNPKTISLNEVTGIRYSVGDELVLFTELFSIKETADLNNVIHWYTIKLVLKDRTEIPLFIAGEFEPKDWLGGRISYLEISVYQKLGLVKDVDGHCRKVLDILLSSIKNAGHELPLI